MQWQNYWNAIRLLHRNSQWVQKLRSTGLQQTIFSRSKFFTSFYHILYFCIYYLTYQYRCSKWVNCKEHSTTTTKSTTTSTGSTSTSQGTTLSPDTPVNTNFMIIKIICSVGVTLILFSGIMITIKCFINRNYATLDEPGILRDSAGEHIPLNTLNENSSLL